jgi:TRAP-type transport system periplasmic protein
LQRFLQRISALALFCLLGSYGVTAFAAEYTLRAHHFLAPSSTVHAELVEPWARRVEEQSGGRLKIEVYPAMQLGGRPPQLYDQVRDGVVDIVWTLPGYTAGRFPRAEVFELPFVPGSARATTLALQDFAEIHLQEEFGDVHPILFHAHAPGTFHMRGAPVSRLEDLRGLKIRAPTRISNMTLAAMGATAVGMPVPAVPESLSRGVIDGALLPYEVTRSLRVQELTDSHTEIAGAHGLYTAVFLFAMNRDSYARLPEDLRAVIDANSGRNIAADVGATWDAAEIPGRDAAEALGDNFHIIEGEELDRWVEATEPVIDEWLAETRSAGIDGATLLEDARRMVRQYLD